MHRSTCPFAAALFGSISGSAAGAAFGVASGWILYAPYVALNGWDAHGLIFLIFGTLGLGVGGSGGAVGGMSEGWNESEEGGSASKWGAALGSLWAFQPILWLAITAPPPIALAFGVGIAAILAGLGGVAATIGGAAARSLGRAFGVGLSSGLPGRGSVRRGRPAS